MSCAFVDWFSLDANAQAAWVQAIGSIVAIFIAVLVPALQHFFAVRRDERQAKLKARSLGLAVRPDLEDLASRLDTIWSYESPDAKEEPIRVLRDRALGAYTLGALDLSPALVSKIPTLHDIGNASDPALSAIHNVLRAKDYVTKGVDGFYPIDPQAFYDHLYEATKQCMHALHRIDGLLSPSIRRVNLIVDGTSAANLD